MFANNLNTSNKQLDALLLSSILGRKNQRFLWSCIASIIQSNVMNDYTPLIMLAWIARKEAKQTNFFEWARQKSTNYLNETNTLSNQVENTVFIHKSVVKKDKSENGKFITV